MTSSQQPRTERMPDPALAASAFIPVLARVDDDGVVEVRLVRRLRIAGEDVNTAVVLAQRFGSDDEAQRRFDWLLTKSGRHRVGPHGGHPGGRCPERHD